MVWVLCVTSFFGFSSAKNGFPNLSYSIGSLFPALRMYLWTGCLMFKYLVHRESRQLNHTVIDAAARLTRDGSIVSPGYQS